jgi:hypothetical protein
MDNIRICQYFKLQTRDGRTHRYQNYFVGQSSQFLSERYEFAPFRAEGAIAALNGDNQQLQILFPHIEYALVLVEAGDGNRLSELELNTTWLDATGTITGSPVTDYYIGLGASFSETTIELRFRSAIDSVGSAFPGRTLTRQLVGPLPLNSELYLR